MPVTEMVRDQRPQDLAPVDQTVVIPPSVRRAAERANQLHEQVYQTEGPTGADGATGTDGGAVTGATGPGPTEVGPTGAAAPLVPDPATQAQGMTVEEMNHRVNSAEGRYKQAMGQVRTLQDQLTQLGDELMRAHNLLQQPAAQGGPQARAATQKLITPEDEQAYTPELIDLARRAGLEAVSPVLDELRGQNQQLSQQLKNVGKRSVAEALTASIPNWQAINHSAEFKNWLRLPDVYANRVRQEMLNEAMQSAQAARVVAFFQGFIDETQATQGTQEPAQQSQPVVASQAPARQAAVTLAQIASPGRARPANGDAPVAKPVFTRAEIATFYDQVRRGAYAGRETEKANREAELFLAQNEGRVR